MVQPTNKRFLLESDKSTANGLATLDGTGKLPAAQFPTPAAAGYIPVWKPNTAYTYLQPVVSPNGDVVTAKNNFTSGATYDPNLWNLSSSYGQFISNGNLFSPKGVQAQTLVINGSTAQGGTRIPVLTGVTIDGSKLTTANPSDKVGHSHTVLFKGGFSNEVNNATTNIGWLWGANDFIQTGTATGDVDGITTVEARLTELHLNTPGATINDAYGLVGDIGIGASAVGMTVTNQIASMFLKGPTNNAGASVNMASTLFLGSPLSTAATNTYAINSSGEGKVLINGDISMNSDPSRGKLLNVYHGTVQAKTIVAGAPTDLPTGVRMGAKSAADSEVVSWFIGRGGQSADIMRIGRDTYITTRFDKQGRLVINPSVTSAPADADLLNGDISFTVESTAGTPRLVLKGKDSAGTVFTRKISLAAQSGATGSRPSATTVGAGAQFYDTTLSKPVWSDGTTWRDAMGTAA